MRHEVLDFTWGGGVKTTAVTATSDGIVCDRYREKTVGVDFTTGGFTGSVDIEGTLDGNRWYPVFTGVTGDGLYEVTAAMKMLRLNVTRTGGVLRAQMGGFDSRSDM